MSIVCSGCHIPSDTKLACPKCIQLGLPATFYCSQDCFTKNYSTHKQIHTSVAKQQPARDGISCSSLESQHVRESLPYWAQTYSFTGSLRPCLLSPVRSVRAGIRKPDYADHPQGVSLEEQQSRGSQIHVYSENELRAPDDPRGLRHACRMGREVLDVASRALRVGVTTDEIDRVVHDACMERNVYPSPLNYYNFPKSVRNASCCNKMICRSH
jgi:methionyl aminopeptidase